MFTLLIFFGGFIAGFVASAAIRISAENNSTIGSNREYLEYEAEDRRNNKINTTSKTLEIIRLIPLEKPQNAYYNNEVIFSTFCLEDIESLSENELQIIMNEDPRIQMKDIDKMIELGKILPSRFEIHFLNLLNSGKVTIYSKVESRFIDVIKRDKCNIHAGPLAAADGYNYFLPDGSCFFQVTTRVS
jgi:hypothetical protein